MRVGIIQSNYLPWRGYFDFIADVDLFVVHDDIQFTKGDWRNRNRIKTPQGCRWFTVPVHHHHTAQRICDTAIDYSQPWQRTHLNLIAANLGKAPFVADVVRLLEPTLAAGPATISDLNVSLLRSFCGYLGIATPLRLSSEFAVEGTKTDRLIALLTAAGATTYVSGPSAAAYLEQSRFIEAGIGLEYKTYQYRDYPQLWGPFEGAVSVIDLVANCGPQARGWLDSCAANRIAA